MATVSFADLAASFQPANVPQLGSSVVLTPPSDFFWITPTGDRVALSGTGFFYNIGAYGGTVTQLTVDIGNDGGSSDVLISGLSVSLATLVTALQTADDAVRKELFWRAILGGDDTIDYGASGNAAAMIGDGFTVSASSVVYAGDDTVFGHTRSLPFLSADFQSVEVAGKLHGGNDIVDVTLSVYGSIYGDAETVGGGFDRRR